MPSAGPIQSGERSSGPLGPTLGVCTPDPLPGEGGRCSVSSRDTARNRFSCKFFGIGQTSVHSFLRPHAKRTFVKCAQTTLRLAVKVWSKFAARLLETDNAAESERLASQTRLHKEDQFVYARKNS